VRRALAALALAGSLAALASCGGTSGPKGSYSTTEPGAHVVYSVTVTAHAGPTCPVERQDQSCVDAPVRGTVTISSSGITVGSGSTDTDGRYVFEFAEPGSYRVTVDTGAMLPRCEPVDVTVVDHNVDVDVSCDTGIR
jgi:hypothetical protein